MMTRNPLVYRLKTKSDRMQKSLPSPRHGEIEYYLL